jgi:acetyl-CoA carboxylase biotin carboxyl carrier protein
VNARELRRLADLLSEYGLTELEVEQEGMRVRLRRDAPPAPGAHAAVAPAASAAPGSAAAASGEAAETPLLSVEAPMVGTFYRAPSPEAAPYVREGDRVKKGQVVCIIEAMKLMNEIESKVAGRVVKVLVENAQPVQYGQPLFLLEP